MEREGQVMRAPGMHFRGFKRAFLAFLIFLDRVDGGRQNNSQWVLYSEVPALQMKSKNRRLDLSNSLIELDTLPRNAQGSVEGPPG